MQGGTFSSQGVEYKQRPFCGPEHMAASSLVWAGGVNLDCH